MNTKKKILVVFGVLGVIVLVSTLLYVTLGTPTSEPYDPTKSSSQESSSQTSTSTINNVVDKDVDESKEDEVEVQKEKEAKEAEQKAREEQARKESVEYRKEKDAFQEQNKNHAEEQAKEIANRKKIDWTNLEDAGLNKTLSTLEKNASKLDITSKQVSNADFVTWIQKDVRCYYPSLDIGLYFDEATKTVEIIGTKQDTSLISKEMGELIHRLAMKTSYGDCNITEVAG